jgi:hypothetical protein
VITQDNNKKTNKKCVLSITDEKTEQMAKFSVLEEGTKKKASVGVFSLF